MSPEGGPTSEGRRSSASTTLAALGVNLAATAASTAACASSAPVSGVFVLLRRVPGAAGSHPRPGVCSHDWRTGRCRSTEPTLLGLTNLTDGRTPASIERITAAPFGVASAASSPTRAFTATETLLVLSRRETSEPPVYGPAAPVAGVFGRPPLGVLDARRLPASTPGVCS